MNTHALLNVVNVLLASEGNGLLDRMGEYFRTAPTTPAVMGPSLWWIIALPLAGAFLCGVFGRYLGRANVHLVACGTVLTSFFLSLLAMWTTADAEVTQNRYSFGFDYGTWFAAGDFKVNFGLSVDHLSGSMLLVITGIGFLIHLYSTSYMSHDPGYWRFFSYLNLFVAMMLTLVLADSLVLLFVGWEGVGLCSYLLIGFWYDDAAKAYAGRKAFITNRIGDFGFLVGSFLLVLVVSAAGRQLNNPAVVNAMKNQAAHAGPLAFTTLETMSAGFSSRAELATEITDGPLHGHSFGGVLTVILLCFLLGAAGKSAQLPLFVWLPDAMAGPTPVSALIHAATMVTAGVYLFCRISYLVVLSPTAMAVVAVVGGLTALIAALIAFAQNDLKKVLAYSTVSQLGMMFMAVGAGVFWAAFLHVVTHAFFKACLFLGAGSVMHGNADEGDVRKLGGLRKEMKFTWATFGIATLAITGIVPLSGFFSKDSILHGLHTAQIEDHPHVLHFVWATGLLTALCTAFYMTRLYILAFEGERAKDAKVAHAHESDWVILTVLILLAAGSVILAAHGIPFMQNSSGFGPDQTIMENFLSPVFRTSNALVSNLGLVRYEHHEGLPWGAWGLAWVIALTGGASAAFLYTRYFPSRAGKPLPKPWAFAKKLSENKFYVDELYDMVLIRPLKGISVVFYKVIDSVFIDTIAVRGTAWVTERTGSLLRYFQTGDAQSYAAMMALALAAGLVWALLRVKV